MQPKLPTENRRPPEPSEQSLNAERNSDFRAAIRREEARAGHTPDPAQQFETISHQIVDLMKQVAPLADQRASTFLMTLGTVVMVLAFLGKVKILGVSIGELETSEFITMALVALVLLVGGTGLRVYGMRLAIHTTQAVTDVGTRIVERTQDAAIRMLETTQRQATKSFEPPPTPDPNKYGL